MVIQVPTSISKRFSARAIDEAFRRGRAVATGSQIAGEETAEGKRAFDNFRSASVDFRREIQKGQASRFTSARLQEIKEPSFIRETTLKRRGTFIPTKAKTPSQIFGPKLPTDFQRKQIQPTLTPIQLKRFQDQELIRLVKEEDKLGITKTGERLELIEQRIQILRQQKDTPLNKLKRADLRFAQTLIASGVGLVALAKGLKTDPVGTIKSIPGAFKEDVKTTIQIFKVSKTEGIAKIGADLVTLKFISGGAKITGKVSTKVATKLSPKFAKIKKQTITIPSQTPGKTIDIKIGGTVKKLKEPLKKQKELAGKEVTAVSAQADQLFSLTKSKRVIRKPIPSEDLLKPSTKKLLKKFDDGKITRKQIITLNNRIRIETKGAGSLLERSFFADPRGRLRPSRLGLQQREASFKDILKGDVTFKTNKPQVLIFEDIKIQKFPKTAKFNRIKSKLGSNKPLTKAEADLLLDFQLKVSGKFKPIGALSKEPEITLAPGELIKKGKTIAVTLINGKRVPIVSAKIIKASKPLKKLLEKSKRGKLTRQDIRKLERMIKKETGFRTSLTRKSKLKPRVAIKRKAVSSFITRATRRRKKKVIKRGDRPRRIPRPPKRPPRRPPKRPPRRPPRRPTRRPKPRVRGKPSARPTRRPIRLAGKPPARPFVKAGGKRRIRKKKRPARSFNVWVKPRGKRKFIKANTQPVSKTRAKDLGSYLIDQSLARTYKLRPNTKKPSKLGKIVPPGYSRKTRKKFRTFRQRKGIRKRLKNTFIEKGRFLLDTRGEKRGISVARKIAEIRRGSRLKVKRKKSRTKSKRRTRR